MAAATPSIAETLKPPRRRRCIPVSLKLFLAILVLLCVGSAMWIGVRAHRQQAAIWHLRGFGVEIRSDTSRVGPGWLRRWIGEQRLESLGKVQDLNLSGTNLTDADLAYLKDLNGLEWLALNRNPITDEGMSHLGRIHTLRALRVEDSLVTDAGLVYLAELNHLEVLSLKRTRITGLGLKHLRRLPRLNHLDVEGNLLHDAAVTNLRELKGLRELRVRGTRLRAAAVAEIEQSLPLLVRASR